MSKEYIYEIIDNKINVLDTSYIIKFIKEYNFNENLKKLCNTLKLNKSITTIKLSRKQLKDFYPNDVKDKIYYLITEISKVINVKSNITSITLTDDFTLEELNPLFEALQYNSSITELELSNNIIHTFLDKNNPNLDIIKKYEKFQSSINNTIFSNRCKNKIITNINSTMKVIQNNIIKLYNQVIKKTPFYRMLSKNKTITTLNLSNNINIYKILLDCVESNIFFKVLHQTNIKSLDLKYCDIPEYLLKIFIKHVKCLDILTVSLDLYDYIENRSVMDETLKKFTPLMKKYSNLKELKILCNIHILHGHPYEDLLTIKNK